MLVEMSNNMADFTASGVSFRYLNEPQLTSVRPSSGPVIGSSLITLQGEHFLPGETSCRFGSSEVEATYVSAGVAQCMSPAHDGTPALRVFVDVSTNGVDFKNSRSVNSHMSCFHCIGDAS